MEDDDLDVHIVAAAVADSMDVVVVVAVGTNAGDRDRDAAGDDSMEVVDERRLPVRDRRSEAEERKWDGLLAVGRRGLLQDDTSDYCAPFHVVTR